MSLWMLLALAIAWSGCVWLGAAALCGLSPAPKTAQLIWRVAAMLVPMPFLLSLIVPGLPETYAVALPDVPLLEPLIVGVDSEGGVLARTPLALPSFGVMLLGLLVGGWAVRALLWVRGQGRLQAVKRAAKPSGLDATNWAVALDLPDEPEVRLTPHGSAFVAGVRAPVIYVPAPLAETGDVQQILAHECVHLKQGDLVTRPFERVVADVFWYSPFAWMIRERLDYWREAVTDEAAAALTGDTIAYARALTRAAKFARPLTPMPVAAFILPNRRTLKMRLNHLLKPAPRRPRRLAWASLAAGLIALPLAVAQGVAIKGEAVGDAPNYTHHVLDKAKLTSEYGPRVSPFTNKPGWHNGTDLADEIGKPVYAPADGLVTFAGEKNGYGNMIGLSLAGDTSMRFGQLSEILVAEGDTLKAGDVIGRMGMSGKATGPHLHFEVWHGKKPHDPEEEPNLILAKELYVPAAIKARKKERAKAEASESSPKAMTVSIPAGCAAYDTWFKNTPTPDEWAVRLAKAKSENAARGLSAPSKDFNPKTISLPRPFYPQAAVTNGLMGACMVVFDLSEDGRATDVEALCSDPVFEASAIKGMGVAQFDSEQSKGAAMKRSGVLYPLSYCM